MPESRPVPPDIEHKEWGETVYDRHPMNRVLPSKAVLACYKTITGTGLLMYCTNINDEQPSMTWEYPTFAEAVRAMHRDWAGDIAYNDE